MSYRVFWTPEAEASLANLLHESEAPRELAAVAKEIDRHLTEDPVHFGESRLQSVRMAFIRPLGVQFDVLDDVQTVIVDAVWRIDRK
jgi:hypothetical protein